jgi:hypothetical protein
MIVTQVAPEELKQFSNWAAEFFANPVPPDLTSQAQLNPLGIGSGEVMVAATLAAAAVSHHSLVWLAGQQTPSADEWQAQETRWQQMFSPEYGLE